MARQPKIVVVGAGLVGGSAALFLAAGVPSAEIVMIDRTEVRAEGQVLDLAHAAAFWRSARLFSGTYSDARDADIVVITAGVGVKQGQTRLDIAGINARIICQIVDEIAPQAPDAIYVVASNPCDVLAHVIWARLGTPRNRVISTGCALDSARLRSLLSERLNVVATAIHAYVLGEHGASAIVHWSGANIAGMPLEAFLSRTGKELSPASRDLMLRSVHGSAQLIKEGKGATHYGIGSAVARICQAILHDGDLILPVGTVLSEVEGVPDVCVSLPLLLDKNGAELLAYPVLDADESRGLRESAAAVKQVTEAVLADL